FRARAYHHRRRSGDATMKPTQQLGAGVLCCVLILAAIGNFWPSPEPKSDTILIKGHVGNLKVPYFAHPEVQRILRERYGIEVDVIGMATTEMLCPKDPAD